MNVPNNFSDLKDYRIKGRCQHLLGDILGLVFCGTLADCDDFTEIEDYGKDNVEFLKSELGFEFLNGIPSEDTMNRMLRYLKQDQLEKAFKVCLEELSLKGKHLSIDGKALRGTIPEGKKHALVHMVNVWVDSFGLSFGQLQVSEKSNEITAIPTLIDSIDCEGSVITIDAMGCQKEIVKHIREAKADYVIAIKANQKSLYHEVIDFMEKKKNTLPFYHTLNKGHGRGEERKVYVAYDIPWVDEAMNWTDFHTLAMVERIRYLPSGKEEKQTQYYMSSLKKNTSVESFYNYIKNHWAIENKLHWQLDFTFSEDDSKVKKDNGPANLHLIRKWALHLFKKDPEKISIKRKRKKASRSNNYLKKILNL